ncbi:MAG: hypothetical protein E7021_01590 [Alphaproteobacteria bacterium]|nr:hypothetical protein [Alphaproteobacteria bacterium]
MNINAYPFKIILKKQKDIDFSISDLFDYITSQKEGPIDICKKKRNLFIQPVASSSYYAGLLFSSRDYSAHCRVVVNPNGGYSTEIAEIKDGAEYNFFILNKNTTSGIWLTYANSASLSVLEKILRKFFDDFVSLKGYDSSSLSFKRKNKISCIQIIKAEEASMALNRFFSITSISYLEQSTKRSIFTPDFVKSEQKQIIFKRKAPLSDIIPKILDLKELGTKKLKVVGKNEEGEREVINLDNIFRPLTSYDYDDVTRELKKFNTEELSTHPTIVHMLDFVKSNVICRDLGII